MSSSAPVFDSLGVALAISPSHSVQHRHQLEEQRRTDERQVSGAERQQARAPRRARSFGWSMIGTNASIVRIPARWSAFFVSGLPTALPEPQPARSPPNGIEDCAFDLSAPGRRVSRLPLCTSFQAFSFDRLAS